MEAFVYTDYSTGLNDHLISHQYPLPLPQDLRNLHTVLPRIRDFGFTIRPEKCSFGEQQLGYLGLLLDKDGLRPDPIKIIAIHDMPPPRDLTGVRSFLGAVNYYGKFVPNMHR